MINVEAEIKNLRFSFAVSKETCIFASTSILNRRRVVRQPIAVGIFYAHRLFI